MKRALIAAAVGLMISGLMMAQGGGFRGRAGGGTPPDPATRIADQVTRLTTLLDLTSSQAAQMTTILTNEQSATSTLQTTVGTDQTALRSAIESNSPGTIDQLATAIGTLNGQILSIRAKAQAAMYAILTTAQQTKLAAVGGIGALGGGPGGPGGPGGRGPR